MSVAILPRENIAAVVAEMRQGNRLSPKLYRGFTFSLPGGSMFRAVSAMAWHTKW